MGCHIVFCERDLVGTGIFLSLVIGRDTGVYNCAYRICAAVSELFLDYFCDCHISPREKARILPAKNKSPYGDVPVSYRILQFSNGHH